MKGQIVMAEEYREYRRRQRDSSKKEQKKNHTILKKLLRQTVFSIIILSAALGLRAVDPNNTTQTGKIFRDAMTNPVITAKFQTVIDKIFKTPKEGQTNETAQPIPDQTE